MSVSLRGILGSALLFIHFACNNSDVGQGTVGGGMLSASTQEIKECEGIVNLFANAILGRNYQAAYDLTSTSYQNTVRYDAFIKHDQEMKISSGNPTSWEMPGDAKFLLQTGGSFVIFRSRMEDGQILGAYATYMTFEEDQTGKCRLGNLEFVPWADVSTREQTPEDYRESVDTFIEDNFSEDE